VVSIVVEKLFVDESIRFLELANNNLHGFVPPEVGDSSRLTGLIFGGNQLTGTLPTELAKLTTLELLSIGENQFEGSIAELLGLMPRQEMLYLFKSGLTGAIPDSFCNSTTISRRIVVMCGTTTPCSCCSTSDPNAVVKIECYEDMTEGDTAWLELFIFETRSTI
jgi:hypothetical protein